MVMSVSCPKVVFAPFTWKRTQRAAVGPKTTVWLLASAGQVPLAAWVYELPVWLTRMDQLVMFPVVVAAVLP